MGNGSVLEQSLQHTLELDLNGAACRLALPPDKPGSVVVKGGEKGPAHRPEI
jgi:hypothetical protein